LIDKKELEEVKKILKEKGFKYTSAREKILKKILSLHSHFTAEELFYMLKKRYKVSRATVYRTLNILVDLGVVREYDFGKGKKLFEHIIGHKHHYHLICLACGKIEEFKLDEEHERRLRTIANKLEFDVDSIVLSIYGFCKDCRNKNSKAKS